MLFLYLIFSSLRIIPTSSSRYATIRRKRSITEVRDRTTRASRTARSARAAASGIRVKLADRVVFLGQGVGRYAQPSTDRPVVRRRHSEHLAPHDGHVVAHEHVIDLAV